MRGRSRSRPICLPTAYGGRFRGPALVGRAEEYPRFEANLNSALKIAHGLGIEIHLRLDAGPDTGLEVSAVGTDARRWFDRVLVTAYPRGWWTLLRKSVPTSRTRIAAVAKPIGKWDQPFRCVEDSPRWIDAWLQALSAVPAGHSLHGRFRPIPATPCVPVIPAPPDVEPRTLDPGSRFAPLPEAERRLRDRMDRRRRSLTWATSIDVETSRANHLDLIETGALSSGLAAAARLEGANGLRFQRVSRFRARSPHWFILSEEEVRALLPSPETPIHLSGLPSEIGSSSLRFGRDSSGSSVAIPLDPDQGRHFALLGETGMGKSSLLVRLALQAAELGGVVLLDPIGETGRELLSRLPAKDAGRVRWVSPIDAPLGLNALEGSPANSQSDPTILDRRIGDLVTGLKRVRASRYADQSFWGPRIEEMLFRSLRAASLYPNGSLEDALLLLECADRAPRGVPEPARAAVQELHQRVRDRPDELEGALRVLHEIVRSPALRGLLCCKSSSWSAASAVDNRAIVVITGDAPQVGELTARYLLSVYLALLWSEILARPRSEKLFLLSDEVQWFAHESLTDLLRLGRRFNVHVGVATQAIRSLPEPVRDSIWTNCADFVVFRGSPDEAREFSRWLPGIVPGELLALPPGRALAFLGKGSKVEWLKTDALQTGLFRALDIYKSSANRTTVALGSANESEKRAADTDVQPKVEAVPGPPGMRRIFAVIAAWIEKGGDAPEVLIPLEWIRRTANSDEETLRRAGSTLGRIQALRTRFEGSTKGTWSIRAESFDGALQPPLSPDERSWGRCRAEDPECS